MSHRHPSELSVEELDRVPPDFAAMVPICGVVGSKAAYTVAVEPWMERYEPIRVEGGAVVLGISSEYPLSELREPGVYQLIWTDSYGMRRRRCYVQVSEVGK